MGKTAKIKLFFLVLLMCHSMVPMLLSQQKGKQISDYQKKLQETKSQIRNLREQISKQIRQEKSSLDQIAQIDQENALIRKYLRQLKDQENLLRKNILQTNKNLLDLQEDLQKQREIYADRLVHFYKHRRLSDLEILLTSKSLNQAVKYLKYRKRIAETDQRRLQNLISTKSKIEEANESKRTQLSRIESLKKEKTREEKRLAVRRKEKETLLAKARNQKDYYENQLERLLSAQKELLRLINSDDFSRANLTIDLSKPTQFTRLKGKMIWPIKGRIIRNFGKNKHKETNRFYMSEGIDIKGSLGEEVKVTCSGVVTRISWLPVFGNLIIINHYGGYKTIYTNLSEIFVSVGEEVKTGQIIGLVGDSGTSGPVLHFQVRKKNKAVNPRTWLTRKPS